MQTFGISQSLHLVSVQGNISQLTEQEAAILLSFIEFINKHYAQVRMLLLALRNQNDFDGHFFIHLHTDGLEVYNFIISFRGSVFYRNYFTNVL